MEEERQDEHDRAPEGIDLGDDAVDLPLDDEVLVNAPSEQEADETRAQWQDAEAQGINPNAPQSETFEQFKARKRIELNGMGLSWWEDNSLDTGLAVLGKVLDSCIDTVATVTAMRREGLPESVLATTFTADLLSGPIILSALQVLGLFEPRLRGEIEAVMSELANATPEPTEEEQAQIQAAGEKVVEAELASFAEESAAQGFVVMTPEQFAASLEAQVADETEGHGDPGLN